MNRTRKLKSVSIAIVLLLSLELSILAYAAEPPVQPMTVYGIVYYDTDPAPEGTNVYAKYDGTEIDSCLTLATGQYYLQLEGPAEGSSIDLWVESENVETIILEYAEILADFDLIITGAPEPENVAPVADAGGPYEGEENEDVIFDGSGSSDSDGTIESYLWEFGDGVTTATGVSTFHIYHVAGTYTVTLTVTDDDGATDIDETIVTVSALPVEGNIPPVADADGPYSVKLGRSVSFDGTGSYDPDEDGTIVSYLWDFGDGETAIVESPSHTYDAVDSYTVTLTVTDNEGATDSDTTAATIRPVGVSGISIDFIQNKDGEDRDWGDYGDTIVVLGSGVTAGEDVKVCWDGLKAWDGEKGVMNSSVAKGDGSFEVWFDVPKAVNGLHYIWVKDMDTGDTYMWDMDFNVIARIKMSPSSGLPDEKITLYGYGFSEEEDIEVVTFDGVDLKITPAVPETDDLGSWDATFKVGDLAYEAYEVYAEDAEGIFATKDFTVGAAISLDPDEGPVGTVVEIEGRGFTPDAEIDTGAVTIDGIIAYVVKADKVGDDGEFKIEVVIPQVSDDDDFDVIVTDGTETADDGFEVTGLAEIELDPDFGVQGTSVSVEGYNFTQISGEEIEIWLCDYDDPDIELYEITHKLDTESNGEFEGKFNVPAKSSAQYKIKAKQVDYNIEAFASFRIGLMIVIPTPLSGPTGTRVTLSGTGFTDNEDWNATFGDYIIVEDEDGDVTGDSDLELDGGIPTFYVPTVEPGTYTISVLDIDSDIAVDVEWTVTATTMVEFDPEKAPNKYNVTISGSYFNADPDEDDVDLEFVLYNVTAKGEADEEWDIDVTNGKSAAKLDDDGNFTGWWLVLEDEEMSLGDYILNVTAEDADNIMAQGYFTVVEKSITVDPRKAKFARGESVAFDISSSFAQHKSYIEIYDPAGDLYWTTDVFTDGSDETEDMWIKVGEIQTVPYYYQTAGGNQLYLLEDAQLGIWSWEWYDSDNDELDSGTFTVSEAAEDIIAKQLEALGGDLTQLSTDFEDITTDMSGLSDDVASLAASVEAAVSASNAANNAISQLATAIANVADTSQNAAQAAEESLAAAANAQKAAESAGASASGLTNLVYGAIVASLVAALAAIVSLMQISRRIAG